MNFFNRFIANLGQRAAASHIKKVTEYFNGLDYDTRLAYLVMMLSVQEQKRVEEGNTDFAPLKKIIRDGIETSIKEGHTIDGLVSYYLYTIQELLNMRKESAEKIKSQLSENNRKFFP